MADIRKRIGRDGPTYQVRYKDPSSESGYSYATFDTLAKARAFREDRKPLKGRTNSDIGTVKQAIDKWLEICEDEGRDDRDPVSPATLEQYRYRARVMKSYEWDCDLHQLTKSDVKKFRSWLKREFSLDKAQKVLSSFHSVLLEMQDREIIRSDPAAGVTVSIDSRYREPVSVPSVADLQTLLRTADRLANSKNQQIAESFERYRAMVYLAADSGMRPQEYLALPFGGLESNGVRVIQALDRSNQIGPPKTRAGRRFILTGGQAVEMARHYAIKRGAEAPEDFVFPARNSGSYQSYRKFLRDGWHRLIDEAGFSEEVREGRKTKIVRKYTPYSLRHFFASMLIENNKSAKYIQTVMGHEDIAMTFDVYGHLIRKRETELEEAHGGVLRYLADSSCGELVAETA